MTKFSAFRYTNNEQRRYESSQQKKINSKILENIVLGNTTSYEEIPDIDDIGKGDIIRSAEDILKPAWKDEDDGGINEESSVNDWLNPKNHLLAKKMRESKFTESLGVTPSWAKLSIDDANKTDAENNLIQGSHLYTAPSARLSKDIIDFSKVKDANFGNAEGNLRVCEFHKSAQIALMVSSTYRLSLFQVDGKTNSKLHSLYLEKFPVRCAHFLQGGEEILLMSGKKSFTYSYNIVTGKLNTIKKFIVFDKTEHTQNFKVSPNEKLFSLLST